MPRVNSQSAEPRAPSLSEHDLDFTVALDRKIEELRVTGLKPSSISMSARRLQQLERAMAKHGTPLADPPKYAGLPISAALSDQQSIAVIVADNAYLI